MEPEKVNGIISTVSDVVNDSDSFVTTLYKKYLHKYDIAETYLENVILKNGIISDDDLEVAARLYGVSTLRKKYINIAKILKKADSLVAKRAVNEADQNTDLDDDWMGYFLEKASIVSDESLRNIFAYILAQECSGRGSIRKVMLDRLALLDKKTAHLFGKLCRLTYSVNISDGREYCIPLYLREDTLVDILKCKDTNFSNEQYCDYKDFLENKRNGDDVGPLEYIEDELELLQEIGLINLSDDGDECDLYSVDKADFGFSVEDKIVGILSLYDSRQHVYYCCTGNVNYTKMGLELYNSLRYAYQAYEGLSELLGAYIILQNKRK